MSSIVSFKAFRILLLSILLILAICVCANVLPSRFLSGWAKKASVETSYKMAQIAAIQNQLENWPPQLGRVFPEQNYYDHNGIVHFDALGHSPRHASPRLSDAFFKLSLTKKRRDTRVVSTNTLNKGSSVNTSCIMDQLGVIYSQVASVSAPFNSCLEN